MSQNHSSHRQLENKRLAKGIFSKPVFASYFAVHLAAIALGFALQPTNQPVAVFWPAPGLLCAVLFLSPKRVWSVFCLLAVTAELCVVVFFEANILADYRWAFAIYYALCNCVECLLAVLIVQIWRINLASRQTSNVAKFTLAAAAGSLCSALLASLGLQAQGVEMTYIQLVQVWWISDYLGMTIMAPLVASWILFWISSRPVRLSFERMLISVVVLGTTAFVFSGNSSSAQSVFHLPYILFPVLIWAALRLPMHLTTAVGLAAIILAVFLTNQGLGPFADGDETLFSQLIPLQTFLALSMLTILTLTLTSQERMQAIKSLELSQDRYKSFVANSEEAVWRVEFDQAMPDNLTLDQQRDWLSSHAYLAESNTSYSRIINKGSPVSQAQLPDTKEVAWREIFSKELVAELTKTGIGKGFDYETRTEDGSPVYWIVNVYAEKQNNKIFRIWGVGQDVTKLVLAKNKLVEQEEKLKKYTQQLVSAEESARRELAADLHDGIAQDLLAIKLGLRSLSAQKETDSKDAIHRLEMAVEDCIKQIRSLLADLVPSGLYELGLESALHELANRIRADRDFHIHIVTKRKPTNRLPDRVRIGLFRSAQEAILNVIKHAGVNHATIELAIDKDQAELSVSDSGIGFDPTSRTKGFGLLAIQERIRSLGGLIDIEAGNGRGSRLLIRVPL